MRDAGSQRGERGNARAAFFRAGAFDDTWDIKRYFNYIS